MKIERNKKLEVLLKTLTKEERGILNEMYLKSIDQLLNLIARYDNNSKIRSAKNSRTSKRSKRKD